MPLHSDLQANAVRGNLTDPGDSKFSIDKNGSLSCFLCSDHIDLQAAADRKLNVRINFYSTLFRCHFGSDHIDLHAAADRKLTVVAVALSILNSGLRCLRRAIFGGVLVFGSSQHFFLFPAQRPRRPERR